MTWHTASIHQRLSVKKTEGTDAEGVVVAVSRDEADEIEDSRTRYLVCDEKKSLEWVDGGAIDASSSRVAGAKGLSPVPKVTAATGGAVTAAGVIELLEQVGVANVDPGLAALIAGAVSFAVGYWKKES